MTKPQPDPLDEKSCNSCGVVRPLTDFHATNDTASGRRGVCRYCTRQYHGEWYDKNKSEKLVKNESYRKRNWEKIKQRSYQRRDPHKARANAAVNNAIKSGSFTKSPCGECQEPVADFHHTDGYEKENWFVGKWLCRKHHAQEHVRLRNPRQAELAHLSEQESE